MFNGKYKKFKNMKNDVNYNEKNTMENYQSIYPSTRTTGSGCGGGAQRVIDCGSISWAGGKSGVYVKLKADEKTIIKKLRQQGLDSRLVLEI